MSIASPTARLSFVVSGGFPFVFTTFAFDQPGDFVISDGANILVLNSDYTVVGGGYNSANQLQTGNVAVVTGGMNNVQLGDTLTLYRGISPIQSTSFASTGLQTPLMIEQDDDLLTCQIQQVETIQYNPFPPVGGGPNALMLGWITAQTGGIPTSIDSLNVVNIPVIQLPLFIAVSIADDLEWWKLRAMQVGDPVTSVGGAFIVPVVNPNSLIWVRVG